MKPRMCSNCGATDSLADMGAAFECYDCGHLMWHDETDDGSYPSGTILR